MRKGAIGLVTAISLLISFTASAEPSWINLGESKGGLKWEAKPGSFELSKNRNNVAVAVLAGRVINAETAEIQLYKWYVSATDCKNKMGKLVSLSISGEFLFDSDFMYGSGSVASNIGEFICGVVDHNSKKASGKSL